MTVTEPGLNSEKDCLDDPDQQCGRAISACYERSRARVIVDLNNGIRISFPVRMAEGLANASPDHLIYIEIAQGGQTLRWPKLNVTLHVPALLQGVFGSKQWMAAQLDAANGVRTSVKVSASREPSTKVEDRPLRLS